MNIFQSLNQKMPAPDFSVYQHSLCAKNPPLDLSELRIDALVQDERLTLSTPVEGDVSLALSYKKNVAAVMSIREQASGEIWNLLQLQGARSKKSYRVSSSMSWHKALADRALQYARHPEAAVKQLAMPHLYEITNLTNAANYEAARTRYSMVINHLKMRFSHALGLYICDVQKY